MLRHDNGKDGRSPGPLANHGFEASYN